MTTTLPISILTKNQKKQIVKHFREDDKNYTLFIELRFDDNCNNGHNSFAITGSLYQKTNSDILKIYERDLISSGAIHGDIAKHAPELADLIKWHLVSTDGPWAYLSNTLYHAGDLDHWGKKKGEPYNFTKKLKFDNSPFLYKASKELLKFIDLVGMAADWKDFKIVKIKDKTGKFSKYSFKGMNTEEWYKAPFKDLI